MPAELKGHIIIITMQNISAFNITREHTGQLAHCILTKTTRGHVCSQKNGRLASTKLYEKEYQEVKATAA